MKAAALKNRTNEPVSWTDANRVYLETEILRLRLLLRRRVLWLRSRWNQDPLRDYRDQVISEAQADLLLTGEAPQAESAFYQEDLKARKISKSITKVEQVLAGQEKELIETGRTTALKVLAHLFGLTPFEEDVLLLCLAPILEPSFERLYAYGQDDIARKYPTPYMALTLFAGTGEARLMARSSFVPEAPLRRFHLVHLESVPCAALDARPLFLDERIADYLLGINRADERVMSFLQPLAPAPLVKDHHALADQLQQWLQASNQKDGQPGLNLVGRRGAGKRAVAYALCQRLGLQLFSLDMTRLPVPPAERYEALRLLERETLLLQMALYVDLNKAEAADRNVLATQEDDVKRLHAFLILGSHAPVQTETEMLSVSIPTLDRDAQLELWQAAVTETGAELNREIEAVVQQFDFGPSMVAKAVTAAQGLAQLRAAGEEARLSREDLWQACRKQAGWHLDELAQRIEPCFNWKDIALPSDTYKQLKEIAAQVANRSQVYEAWGFGEKLKRGRGISALFAGPSGTGKTMAAEILANDLELDLYRIDLAGVVSKYIGETEKNLRRVFDAAEQSGAILFFDEADALFGKRSEVKDSHDRYANIEINYLLQRMEDYRGLAILATNMKSLMDQAFLRRLRFLVDFPFPDQTLRLQIWRKVFPSRAVLGKLDYPFLGRLEIPGGNIKNVALNGAFLAAEQKRPIGMEHLLHALRREYAKINKLMRESELSTYYEMVKQ